MLYSQKSGTSEEKQYIKTFATSENRPNPKGSGYFSLFFSIIFLFAFIGSFVYDFTVLNSYLVFQTWLIFTATILFIWGFSRVKGVNNDWKIGQPTINFVVGMIGVTIALLRLLVIEKP